MPPNQERPEKTDNEIYEEIMAKYPNLKRPKGDTNPKFEEYKEKIVKAYKDGAKSFKTVTFRSAFMAGEAPEPKLKSAEVILLEWPDTKDRNQEREDTEINASTNTALIVEF